MEKHKIILDVDLANGMPVRDIDDGLAIAMALTSPEIELLGCTTCGGNCRTHESTINTLRLLEMAGRADVPVAEGREDPFLQDVSASFDYLEGRTAKYRDFWKDMPLIEQYGVGGTPPEAATTLSPSPLKAHEFIIEMVKKYPGEVTIVKEGSLTNLALAVSVAPEIIPLVKEVVHMGGHVGPMDWDRPGMPDSPPHLWRDTIRMNTNFDPEATVIVVRSGIPFTFVTGVSRDVMLTLEDVDRIEAVGTPYHEFLAQTSRPWVEFNMAVRNHAGAPMWDPFTMAVVFDPSLCYFVDLRFDSERFLAQEYPYLSISPDSVQVRVSMAPAQVDRAHELLIERLIAPLS